MPVVDEGFLAAWIAASTTQAKSSAEVTPMALIDSSFPNVTLDSRGASFSRPLSRRQFLVRTDHGSTPGSSEWGHTSVSTRTLKIEDRRIITKLIKNFLIGIGRSDSLDLDQTSESS